LFCRGFELQFEIPTFILKTTEGGYIIVEASTTVDRPLSQKKMHLFLQVFFVYTEDMMTKAKPADFNKRFDIVGCFIEHDGKFLLLRRHAHKANGDKWGLPAGKVDAEESNTQAILREVKEETDISIPEASLSYFDSLYVRDGSFDIEWHMFANKPDIQPNVRVNPDEHSEYCWVTPKEALQMDLIHDLPESIKLFYKINSKV
jgi:(d)CTP diphosphatase